MIKLGLSKIAPIIGKVSARLARAGKVVMDVVRDRHFQIGVLATFPITARAFVLIRKNQKQAEGKEKLYKKALAEHNAIINVLNAKAKLNKERQERLLAYDTEIKKKMSALQSEIQELNDQIAELKKKKVNDE